MADFSDYSSSDRELQGQALAIRNTSRRKFVTKSYGLWGYLYPIKKSEGVEPFYDFSMNQRRHTVEFTYSRNDGLPSDKKHTLSFTRTSYKKDAILKNLSNLLIVNVDETPILKGGQCNLEDGDQIELYFGSKLLYSYKYRDALVEEKAGDLYEHYVKGTTFGCGAFGEVFSIFRHKTREYYAAKKIKELPDDIPSYEISCMKQLRHPNICELKEVFFHSSGSTYLVMELCQAGNLNDYINEKVYLDECTGRDITFQICSAMAYVHSCGIVHRDLKPANILIKSKDPMQIKIADFGLAKSSDLHGLMRSMGVGTSLYMAPEVCNADNSSQAHDNRVDSWSVGVIVVEMLTGQLPFPLKDTSECRNEMLESPAAKRESLLSPLAEEGYCTTGQVVQFAEFLFTVQPEDRSTLNDALRHEWLLSIAQTTGQSEVKQHLGQIRRAFI